jgi:hypothetical protein
MLETSHPWGTFRYRDEKCLAHRRRRCHPIGHDKMAGLGVASPAMDRACPLQGNQAALDTCAAGDTSAVVTENLAS